MHDSPSSVLRNPMPRLNMRLRRILPDHPMTCRMVDLLYAGTPLAAILVWSLQLITGLSPAIC